MITPHLRGLKEWSHLSAASSLCGACSDACPVRIDIHHHLLHNRRNVAKESPGRLERIGHRLFVWVARRPRLFSLGGAIFRRMLPVLTWLRPPGMRDWLATRNLPKPPRRSFRGEWRRR
ncbi:MAG: lactate utilization protein LutB domain-containing protein [Planctomycetaceae bacterium]